MHLSREQILNAKNLENIEVEIKEWGGTVFVRAMTATQRDEYELSMLDEDGNAKMEDLRAGLVAVTCCDAENNLLFDAADVKALSEKSAAGVNKAFSAAQKINGMTKEDMEELTKKS